MDVSRHLPVFSLVGGQGRIVGVLVVDNKYLLGESSIDDEQLDSLELYSRILALSIDNARLRERIAENLGQQSWLTRLKSGLGEPATV